MLDAVHLLTTKSIVQGVQNNIFMANDLLPWFFYGGEYAHFFVRVYASACVHAHHAAVCADTRLRIPHQEQ